MSTIRKVKIMEVTPEVATRWLEKNTHNREVRENKAKEFADAISCGKWQLTTDAIAFCRPHNGADGVKHEETLINGQHRLWAVVLANKPAMFTVWWGCEPEEFGVIDQGVPRTQGDILQAMRPDLLHPKALISVITPTLAFVFARRDKVTTWHTELMLRNYPHELDATVESKKRLGKICVGSVQAALFISILIDEAKTGALVERLHSAVGFSERDPVRALHFYLHSQLEAARESREVVFYKTLHACLAQIDERPLVRLQPHVDSLGDARRRAKDKIDGVCREIFGGKLPEFFYYPRNTVHTTKPQSRLKPEAIVAA